MEPFEFLRVGRIDSAVRAGAKRPARFIAGGTNLLDLMKCGVERPAQLVDVNAVPMATIEATSKGIRIGALARMSDVAAHPDVRGMAPAVAQALHASASPQIRNMASIGGNLMQRTRCPYFRELTFTPCNKRDPGSGCSAIGGENRMHAVLGTSDACIATHPSDLAVALAALDAVITLHGSEGERHVAATAFHLLPRSTPHLEHDLRHGELITSVFVPAAKHAARSLYLKIRDRASFEFALASSAVGLDITDGIIRSARIALGGVATRPWRSREAEDALAGHAPGEALFARAAGIAMSGAHASEKNGFKIELGKRTLIRALSQLAGGEA